MTTDANGSSLRPALLRCAVWFAAAAGFGGFLWLTRGPEPAQQYFAGYLIELSLSADNLFVFALVFERFAIEPARQHRVLFWGIVGAVVLRTAFILAGVGAIARFHWLLYVFGALILATGARLALSRAPAKGFDPADSAALRFLTRHLPVAAESGGIRFFSKIDGRRVATTLFAALIVLEAADLVFALDSIPAVIAVTRDAFIATSSNIFAILGLRSLYLVVSGAMRRFRFLRAGLSTLLIFIGAKMLAEPWYRLPTPATLGIIGGVLAAAIAASYFMKRPSHSGLGSGQDFQGPNTR
jgi:tellurite resistance protein TerC